ncbi:hypothetical protein Q31b_45100 [Novipirellula aureliae]|uniref:Uncharacterized protein n=1 Tax=Novipirellula aureliae TaxID=2527966 RepID=A0A5C6DPY8_9BACT|nr:hypothetical protein [Novipirellula aureliae]TWU37721.1 hypothetical protein Q31b_45100 [Novipirellula aureliae]
MNQSAFSVSRRRPRILLRFTFAATLSAGLSFSCTPVLASDCGCNTCGMGEVVMSDPCGCHSCDGGGVTKNHNPIFRTLDALAGGIEKVLGLDKCKSSHVGCDSGCDASPYYESMMAIPNPVPMMSNSQSFDSHSSQSVPPPPVVTPHQTSPRPSYESRPSYPSSPSNVPMQSAPMQSAPMQSAPRTPMHMSEPRIQTPVPNQRQENGDSGGGSLFDSLSDPFSDEARRPQTQTIRPTAFNASKQTSSRRTSQR